MIKPTRQDLKYVAGLLGVVGVFAFICRGFLAGERTPIYDPDDFFAPYFMLVADFGHQAKLFWWNPWTDRGSPDFVNPQIGAHGPIVLGAALLFGSTLRGFVLFWFMSWILHGVGIVLWARRWAVSEWGGTPHCAWSHLFGLFRWTCPAQLRSAPAAVRVPVRTGANLIEFDYHPSARPWLAFASWIITVTVVGITVWGRRSMRLQGKTA